MALESTSPEPTFANKKALYAWLVQQVETLLDDTPPCFPSSPMSSSSSSLYALHRLISALGNVSALCFYALNRFAQHDAALHALVVNWCGFYLCTAPQTLTLGPFQGRVACTRISFARGACGEAAREGKTVLLPDVHNFAGHIACDSASRSELVVPLFGTANVSAQRTTTIHATTSTTDSPTGSPAEAERHDAHAVHVDGCRHKDRDRPTSAMSDAPNRRDGCDNDVVVGVFDLDSIHVNFFDADDAAGLAAVLSVVRKHLDLSPLVGHPVVRVPSSHSSSSPSMAMNARSVLPWNTRHTVDSAAVTAPNSPSPTHPKTRQHEPQRTAVATTTTTTTSMVNKATITTTQREVGGWVFTITRLNQIASQAELAALEGALNIAAFPEILFLSNRLTVGRRCARADRTSCSGSDNNTHVAGTHATRSSSSDDAPGRRVGGERDVVNVLDIHARAMLAAAAAFYTTRHYRDEVAGEMVLPHTQWRDAAASRFKMFDARVDWAWRQEFIGLCTPPAQVERGPCVKDKPHQPREHERRHCNTDDDMDSVSDNDGSSDHEVEQSEATTDRVFVPSEDPRWGVNSSGVSGINWHLLRDTTLPILLYDSLDLMEDDLHDNGLVRSSVKLRVMAGAFFILQRHLIRINGDGVWIREVRYFHEFASSSSSGSEAAATESVNDKAATDARIAIEVQLRRLSIKARRDVAWVELSDDAVSQMAECVHKEEFYIDV